MKCRALRLYSGNFSSGTEVNTQEGVRVLEITCNNKLVRTNLTALVEGCIVLVDAHPFKAWCERHYGVKDGLKKGKKGKKAAPVEETTTKQSVHVLRKLAKRQDGRTLETLLDDQFDSGRLLAKLSSNPGQSGRCDGYLLEGKELEFYKKLMGKKGKK